MKTTLIGIFLILTSFTSIAHEWKQMYLLAEPGPSKHSTSNEPSDSESVKITVLFDATYAVPKLRDDPNSGAQPREWLEFLPEEEHAEMQREAARVLNQSLEFKYYLTSDLSNKLYKKIQPSYSFPNWQSNPPTFPQSLGGFAYFHVTCSLKHSPSQPLYLNITDHPLSTNVLLEINTPQKPEAFITIKKGNSVCLTHLLNIDAADPSNLRPESESSQLRGLWSAFTLGVTHVIPYGIDHVLFIICLSIAASSAKHAIKFALAFTLAHMITFSAVYSGLIALPIWLSNLIELAIIGSILLMAILNLKENQNTKYMGLIFLFGIIHGLGFGSALQSGITRQSLEIVPTLLFINLGIDLAQLSIIAILVAIISAFPKQKKNLKFFINLFVLSVALSLCILKAL